MPFTDKDADDLTRRLLAVKQTDDPKDYDWVDDLPLATPIDDTDPLQRRRIPGHTATEPDA